MDVTVTGDKRTRAGLDALIAGGTLVGKIGWTAQDIHTDPETGATQPVAKTALLNEFGYASKLNGKTTVIPARPFLRNTISRESRNWLNDIMRGGELVHNNQINFNTVLEITTTTAINDVRTTVRARIAPPLAPYTLKQRLTNSIRRGGPLTSGTLPLLDTGHMLNTLTNEVIPT